MRQDFEFDTIFPRRSCGAEKWDMARNSKGELPEGVVPMTVADMEFKSAPQVRDALRELADFGMWGYTAPTQACLDAVCAWFKNRHGWSVQPEWLVQTVNVVAALGGAVRAFTKSGDRVIIQTPVYPPFYRTVTSNGRTLVENPLRRDGMDYRMDLDDLAEKAKGAAMLILCSPHNPVGRVWTEEELRRMGDICLKHNVLVVSDEIHFDLIMPGYRHISYPTLGEKYADSCVMFTAASKTFSLAGLCVANAIIPNAELRKKLDDEVNVCGCYSYSIFGMRALETGYWKCGDWVDQLNEHIWGNYQYFKSFMAEHFPGVWVADLEGTYLCWFDCRCFGMDGQTLAKFLVEKAQLFLDDGYIFGPSGDGFERINLACTRKVLEDALHRFKAAMDQR